MDSDRDGRETKQVSNALHPVDVWHKERRNAPAEVPDDHDHGEPTPIVHQCPSCELNQQVDVEIRRITAQGVRQRDRRCDDEKRRAANVERPGEPRGLMMGAPSERKHCDSSEPVDRHQLQVGLIGAGRPVAEREPLIGDSGADQHRRQVPPAE